MDTSTFISSFTFKEVFYETYHESAFTVPVRQNYVMYLQKGRAEISSGGEVVELFAGDIQTILGDAQKPHENEVGDPTHAQRFGQGLFGQQ